MRLIKLLLSKNSNKPYDQEYNQMNFEYLYTKFTITR